MESKRKRVQRKKGSQEPQNFRRLDRRFSTAAANDEDEECLGPHVSQAVTEQIMKFRKCGSKTDPFSKENQAIIDELIRLAENKDTTVLPGGFVKGNLAEATLLLEYSVKIYSKRVELTRQQVYKFAERCTRTERSFTVTEQEIIDDSFSNLGTKRHDMTKSIAEAQSDCEEDSIMNATRDSGGYVSLNNSKVADDLDDDVENLPVEPGETINLEELDTRPEPDVNESQKVRVIECITLSDDEDVPMGENTIVPEPLLDNPPGGKGPDVTNPPEVAELVPDIPPTVAELVPDIPPELVPDIPPKVATEEPTSIPERTDQWTQSLLEPETHALETDLDDNSEGTETNNNTEESEPSPRKRLKKDYGPPPTLISCLDEEPTHDFDDTPKLTREVNKRKERIRWDLVESQDVPENSKSRQKCSNSKEEIPVDGTLPLVPSTHPTSSSDGADLVEWDQAVELGAEVQNAPVPQELTAPATEQISGPEAQETTTPVTSTPLPIIPRVHALLKGVVIKLERIDNGYLRNSGENFGGVSTSDDSATRASFTPEDEVQLLKCIQHLHSLTFSSELSQGEQTKAFEEAVSRLEDMYKEHNVPIERHVVEAASDACSQISSYGQWLYTDKDVIPAPPDLHELFSQRCSQEAWNSQDLERTIMETTEERTQVQSNSRMREMLSELQRSIVPKYTNIPLIEENTKEFFLRVKSFENRMKKVLAEEEIKEEFDIRKYEQEVLDVTHSEVGEVDPVIGIVGDEIQSGPSASPIRALTPDGAVPEGQAPIPAFNVDGLPSPSPSSHSGSTGEGVRWVSLKKIFSHMKTLERTEAARMFYAVLALLSFENLDIKYDNHFSAESAALVAKNWDHEADCRFPRGVKIMTSGCADVDKEDVYIAALTDKSRTETFRELEFQHSQELESRQLRTRRPQSKKATAAVLDRRPYQAPQQIPEEQEPLCKAAEYLCREFQIRLKCLPHSRHTGKGSGQGSFNGLLRTVASSKKRAGGTGHHDAGPPSPKKISTTTPTIQD